MMGQKYDVMMGLDEFLVQISNECYVGRLWVFE
jgi:hypothetical protein